MNKLPVDAVANAMKVHTVMRDNIASRSMITLDRYIDYHYEMLVTNCHYIKDNFRGGLHCSVTRRKVSDRMDAMTYDADQLVQCFHAQQAK